MLSLLRLLLAELLVLLRLALASLLDLIQLLLADLLVLLSGVLGFFDVLGAFLLALLVLGAEEVSNYLEEVGCDFELGADDGEAESPQTWSSVLVLGRLVVLVYVDVLARAW